MVAEPVAEPSSFSRSLAADCQTWLPCYTEHFTSGGVASFSYRTKPRDLISVAKHTYIYIINVAAKFKLFLRYSIFSGYPVFLSSYKVTYRRLGTFYESSLWSRLQFVFNQRRKNKLYCSGFSLATHPLPHSSSIKPINSFRKCIPKWMRVISNRQSAINLCVAGTQRNGHIKGSCRS